MRKRFKAAVIRSILATAAVGAASIDAAVAVHPGGFADDTRRAADAAGQVIVLREVTGDGTGREVGRVQLEDPPHGLLITPDLHGLSPGVHGLHVHENPDCGARVKNGRSIPAGAAGGHYDPGATGRHAGPYGDGHLGDLPNLYVEKDGTASIPVLAPRLELADVQGRSLMIHAGADRYSSHAQHAHGKGGVRMYCGIDE